MGLPLRSVTTGGRGRMQKWAEGEVGPWCCPSIALGPPHWELWTWGGSLELLWVKAKVLGIYVPSWSIFAYICPEKGRTVGKRSSQPFPEDSLHLGFLPAAVPIAWRIEQVSPFFLKGELGNMASTTLQNLPTSSSPLICHSQILFHNFQVIILKQGLE